MQRALVIVALVCLSATSVVAGDADPGWNPMWGYGNINPADNPSIVGVQNTITVSLKNSGIVDPATNVKVRLSYNDWGVTFAGWQEISTQLIPSIAPAASASTTHTYTFMNAAHTCLEATVVSADENVDISNDRTQINMEVVNAGDETNFGVPFGNGRDGQGHGVPGAAEVVLKPDDVKILCGDAGDQQGIMVECDPADGVQLDLPSAGLNLIPGAPAQVVNLHVKFPPGTDDAERLVRIIAKDPAAGGQVNHVDVLVVVKPSENLFGELMYGCNGLACIKDHCKLYDKLFVLLQKARNAFIKGNIPAMINYLRMIAFEIQKAIRSGELTREQMACLSKMLRIIIDMCRKHAEPAIATIADATEKADAVAMFQSADASRLAGKTADCMARYLIVAKKESTANIKQIGGTFAVDSFFDIA